MSRSCLPCTECCRGALEANENGINIGYGKPCEHVTEQGCGIGEARPETPCKAYRCGWLIEPTMPENLRPDLSGAILHFDFGQFEGRNYDLLSATKGAVPNATKKLFIENYIARDRGLVIKEVVEGKLERAIQSVGNEAFQKFISEKIIDGCSF